MAPPMGDPMAPPRTIYEMAKISGSQCPGIWITGNKQLEF